MNKPPIGDAEGKKDEVERMFDSIAPKYDLINRILSLGVDQGWRRRTISLVNEFDPAAVLDVATGTADLALQAVEAGCGSVVGVDISEEMLAVGRTKIASRNLQSRITLERGDATNLSAGDESFDAVMVAFGVRNFENLDAGLREMRRVLRPGGRLVVLEFSQPESFPMKQVCSLYYRFVLPKVGGVISGNANAYKYLPESVQAFPYGEAFVKRMVEVGYQDVFSERLTFGVASIYVGHK